MGCSVGHHIDDDRYGENQNVIGPRDNIHTICISHVEPLFRDLGHALASLVDLIFMIQNIAFNFHILSTGDMNVETLAKWRDQRFLDRGKHITFAVNAIGIFDAHDPFLDGQQFVALHVFKAQVLSQAKCLAIDKKDTLIQGILNPVIIAERDQLLSHAIASTTTALPWLSWLLRFLSTSMSSS